MFHKKDEVSEDDLSLVGWWEQREKNVPEILRGRERAAFIISIFKHSNYTVAGFVVIFQEQCH